MRKQVYILVHYIFGVIASLLITSCADHSYTGPESFNDPELFPKDKIPVILSVSTFDVDINDSRNNTDPKEEIDYSLGDDERIYVYAFEKEDTDNDYSQKASDKSNCFIDASLVTPSNKGGKKAIVNKSTPIVSWAEDPVKIYYPVSPIRYNFYAYYLDNLEIEDSKINRTKDSIYMNVQINGTQDLMTSKAALTKSQLDPDKYTAEELKMFEQNYYSSLTGQKGIQPVFRFKHMMTRFVFRLYPAIREAQNVYVEKIEVLDPINEASFTVVHKDTSNIRINPNSNKRVANFTLMEADGKTDINAGGYKYHPIITDKFTDNVYDNEYVEVGGGLNLMPGVSSYNFKITLRDKLGNGNMGEPYSNIFTIESEDKIFKPGTQCNVRIAIYGRQTIKTSGTITPWIENSENIELDDDEKPII